jgi:hypothetical protein
MHRGRWKCTGSLAKAVRNQGRRRRQLYDRRVRRHRIRGLALAICAIALAGCSTDDDPSLPAACTEGAEAVRVALRAAPAKVRLDGGVPLSGCLIQKSAGTQVQVVGAAYVDAATALAVSARRHPGGRAALELGYLIGAARRGGSTTQGIHSELLRRLDQELATVDTASPAFRRGERAGRREG